MLLEDHALYRTREERFEAVVGEGGDAATFEMGLTEKQRRDRDGVVLPYYDAQSGGGGDGGRILYDMGEEDDFDEEEDEI
jgi:elongator complex protein 5